jgi:hypothetical protein
MQPFLPDFELVKMDAEIGSYQEDQDPDREYPEASPPMSAAETTPTDPGA